MKQNNRISWIDTARGMGIILVVIGHVGRGLTGAGMASGAAWEWLDYSLYTFHMPLFFFLAGLNFPQTMWKGRERFLRGKLRMLAYPYFLWSIIQGCVLIAMSSATNGKVGLSDLLHIGWKPMGQFWFLYVLMVCQIVAAFGAEEIFPLAVGFLLAGYIIPILGVIGMTLHYFPFFACGCMLAGQICEEKPVKAWVGWFYFAALCGAILISGLCDSMNYKSAMTIPAAMFGIMLVVWLGQKFQDSRGLAYLGRVSMTIYILHIMAASGARIALKRIGLVDPLVLLVLCSAVGILCSIMAHEFMRKFRLLYWFGLGSKKA